MLSDEQNRLLTRVEGDAPMGLMLRRNFWVPAVRSARLQAGGAPVRVRLFGMNFIAFRADDGRVGFFDERCPHRGVSLMLARNEDNALRCIFHGWKFGVDGAVLETPTQPVNPREFAQTVKLNHYPAREAAGMLWVWLGREGEPPAFPELEFMGLPQSHFNVRLQVVPFNWVQGIEATIDSSHVGILHADWVNGLGELNLMAENTAPTYDMKMTDYGFKAAALRPLNDGRSYIRVTQFVFPWYSFIPPSGMTTGDRLTIISVPVDDTHSLQIYYRYNIGRPIKHDDWLALKNPDHFSPLPGGYDDAWGQDRNSMKDGSFRGFRDLALEDFVVQISIGAIADRSQEHLCLGDQIIVRTRRLFLQTLERHQAGEGNALNNARQTGLRDVRSISTIAPEGIDWLDPSVAASAR